MIFVSHAHVDEAIYGTVSLTLDNAHLSRWDPSEMSSSESLAEQLREAIRKCHVCVFVATQASIQSRWCLAEAGAFWGAGKKVFLFKGESGLKDNDLPPQFSGNLWTADIKRLINELRKIAPSPPSIVCERPANVYWLGHDLARAIRSAKFAPEADRAELTKDLRQALHHLNEVQLGATDARTLLLAVLKRFSSPSPLGSDEQEFWVTALARAKNELGNAIEHSQAGFRAYPSIAEQERLEEMVRQASDVVPKGGPLPAP